MLTPERINEIADGASYHLRGLESFREELREVSISVQEIRNFKEQQLLAEMREMRHEIKMLTQALQQQGMLNKSYSYENSFSAIKELIDDNSWPAAVAQEQICDSPTKEEDRAKTIVDLVLAEYFKGLKFLDFGCGKGHVPAIVAQNEASFSVGYDIRPEWNNSPAEWRLNPPKNFMLSTDFNEVMQHGPYDVILAYDVLDHCSPDPFAALEQIRQASGGQSKIYIRNHPWCSRHGGHLYLQKNKAFLHLAFDEVELERIRGLCCMETNHVFEPLPTYRDWFSKAGFEIKTEVPETTEVENFFLTNTLVRKRLKEHWGGNTAKMKDNMRINFVDYSLIAKKSTVPIF